ncbi:MAG: hypothetical protein U9N46_05430 [Euryarchaeota archaeon]|nr:hypothetical protein [Euryarchaeota archaeon]
MRWMKSIRIALMVLILSLIAVPVAVCEESECGEVTLVWGERVAIDGYEFEVTDFSSGNMSQIMSDEFIWALVTILKNGTAVWHDVFSTNGTVSDFVYDPNSGSYTFNLSCSGTYVENGTDRIRINASEIVIEDRVHTQKIDVEICIIESTPPITLAEWMNNSFVITKSASIGSYVREKIFIEISITNVSMADRVEISDSIPDEFVVNPDRDLYWNYIRNEYRYSVTPLVPKTYTLPAVNASVWCYGHRINITSNTPETVVNGPYVTITKTAELTNDTVNINNTVNVTVSVKNTGDCAAMVYVFDAIPAGVELIDGALDFKIVLNPEATEYTSEYVNSYALRINGSVTLPRAVVHYQTSKQVDLTREYRPGATFKIEKYINPKFYAAISRSEKIEIGYENDSGQDDGVELEESQEPVGVVNSSESTESTELAESTEFTESTESTESTEPVESTSSEEDVPDKTDETQEKRGVVQKIKSMPGFGAMSALAGILAGCAILIRRNHDLI